MQAIWICSPEYSITFVNAHAAALTPPIGSPLIGKSFLQLVHQDEQSDIREILSNSATTLQHEGLIRIGSDECGWKTCHVCLNRTSDLHMVITGEELTTERFSASQLLDIFQQLIDASDNIVYAFDLEGRCIVSNSPLAKKAGRTTVAMMGLRRKDFLTTDTAFTHEENDRKVAALGATSTIEETNIEAGELQIYLSKKFPVFDKRGQISAVGGISSNVTARRAAENALRESEYQFESLAMISPVGIFRTDINGHCVYVNKQWCDFAGVTLEDALGRYWGEALFWQDAPSVREHWNRAYLDGSTFSSEFRFQRRDGSITWLVGNGKAILDNSGCMSGCIGTLTDITDIRRTQDLLVSARAQIETLARQNWDIQEEERKHLSRELHDELGQMLTALKLGLMQARRKSTSDSALGFIDSSIGIVDDSILVLRNIARRLRPPQLDDLGLVASLRWHIDNLVRQTSQSIVLHETVGNKRFSVDLELVIFRVTQEAISNALRHSLASQIVISLNLSGGYLELAIGDNGIGFDIHTSGPPELPETLISLGLLGMRERTCGIGGEFKISSTRNLGSMVTCRFPIVSEH